MATIAQIKQKATDNLSDILANPKRKPSDIKEVIDLIIDNMTEIGEVKYLKYNITDRNTHFDTNGAGKSTSKWFGWQIINGQNGTTDDGGMVHINYKPGSRALGDTIGHENSVIPGHSIGVGSYGTIGDPTDILYNNVGLGSGTDKVYKYSKKFGRDIDGNPAPNQTHVDTNMQPSRVILAIQRMA